MTVAGVTNGYEFGSQFDTITASKIRLNITNASRPSIFEFELFYNEDTVIDVDKDDLEKVINDANERNKDDYTVSTYNSMLEILKYAKEIFNTDYITQPQIDEAANALNEALNNLLKRADITEAQHLLESYNDLNSELYTKASWLVFEEARQNVNNAIQDPSELSQEQLDELCNKLTDAFMALELKNNADKYVLQIAIEMAEAADLENVVPAVVTEFNEALANAKEVYAKTNATQSEVDNAFDRLASVMQMLEFYKGDKTALQKQVDDINDLDESKYIESSWNAMLPVLDKANDVLADENAMQDEVDGVYTELVKAFLDLRLKPNKDLLNDLINKANGLSAANYSAESWAVVTDALNEAKAVLEDSEASQEQVDNAKDVLAKAMAGLEEVETNNPVKAGDTTASVATGDTFTIMPIVSIGMLSALTALSQINKKKKIQC